MMQNRDEELEAWVFLAAKQSERIQILREEYKQWKELSAEMFDWLWGYTENSATKFDNDHPVKELCDKYEELKNNMP